MGPTASGKTDLAIELAGALDCELVSVDSALVYRGLDIGSAKPDYPHHLVDIRDPPEPILRRILWRTPGLVTAEITGPGQNAPAGGGTMLYFKALLEGLAQMPAADPAFERRLMRRRRPMAGPIFINCWRKSIPAAARIHPNHSQRLSRALEVYRASGVTLTELHSGSRDAASAALPGILEQYRVVQLAICPVDRAVLHQRIARRFELMMAAGFLRGSARLEAASGSVRGVAGHSRRGLSPAVAAPRRGAATLEEAVKRRLRRRANWPNGN